MPDKPLDLGPAPEWTSRIPQGDRAPFNPLPTGVDAIINPNTVPVSGSRHESVVPGETNSKPWKTSPAEHDIGGD
jgi:hypothetical protein